VERRRVLNSSQIDADDKDFLFATDPHRKFQNTKPNLFYGEMTVSHRAISTEFIEGFRFAKLFVSVRG